MQPGPEPLLEVTGLPLQLEEDYQVSVATTAAMVKVTSELLRKLSTIMMHGKVTV